MPATMSPLIVQSLNEMGNEAGSNGNPYGLRGYVGYLHDILGIRFRGGASEEPITHGLHLKLTNKGVLSKPEMYYPGSQERADLVITFPDTNTWWIEVKTAYCEVFNESIQTDLDYYSGDYLKPDTWKHAVKEIVKKDCRKLLNLTKSNASYIGVLLLGFDRVAKPLVGADLQNTISFLSGWDSHHDTAEGVISQDKYAIRAAKGFRDRIWLWHRKVD